MAYYRQKITSLGGKLRGIFGKFGKIVSICLHILEFEKYILFNKGIVLRTLGLRKLKS